MVGKCKQDTKIAAELTSEVCDYYEKYVATGLGVIQEELEKKADEVEIAQQSTQSMKNILNEQQL